VEEVHEMTVTFVPGDSFGVMRTMQDESLDVCITDPPYNVGVPYDGHADKLCAGAYTTWLALRLEEAWRISRKGLVYFPGKTNLLRQREVLLEAGLDPDAARALGWHRTEFAGDKFSGGPALCWEPILWCPKGKPEVEPVYGTAGRDFLVVKSHRRETTPIEHPCPKPTEVMAWLVGLFCPPGGSVLDPFAGSGTTGVVCERTGRDCVLIEQSEAYPWVSA